MGCYIIQVPSRKPIAYSNWQSRTICRKFEQKTIYRCGSEFKDPRQKSSSAPGDCWWINTFKPGSWNWEKVATWNWSPERVPSQLTIPGQGVSGNAVNWPHSCPAILFPTITPIGLTHQEARSQGSFLVQSIQGTEQSGEEWELDLGEPAEVIQHRGDS